MIVKIQICVICVEVSILVSWNRWCVTFKVSSCHWADVSEMECELLTNHATKWSLFYVKKINTVLLWLRGKHCDIWGKSKTANVAQKHAKSLLVVHFVGRVSCPIFCVRVNHVEYFFHQVFNDSFIKFIAVGHIRCLFKLS